MQGLGVELVGEVDLHLALLQLVAGEDDQLAGLGPGQHGLDEPAPERAGAPGDQDHLAVEIQGGRRETAHGRSFTMRSIRIFAQTRPPA